MAFVYTVLLFVVSFAGFRCNGFPARDSAGRITIFQASSVGEFAGVHAHFMVLLIPIHALFIISITIFALP